MTINKRRKLKEIETGLYQLEIVVPNEKLVRGISPIKYPYNETLIKYRVDDACCFTGIKLIVKAERGKNYVEEINTKKRIPIGIIEKNSNIEHGYPNDSCYYHERERYMKEHSSYIISYDNCYKRHGFAFPYFVVAIYEHTIIKERDIPSVNNNVSFNSFSELYFVDSNGIDVSNMFSYNNDDFKSLLDDYTSPEGKERSLAAIDKLNEYEIRNKDLRESINIFENIPLKKHINFSDADKVGAYLKYFHKKGR